MPEISRQAKAQQRLKAQGRCVSCGGFGNGKTRCNRCADVARRYPTREQWAAVDWTKRQKEIAAEMGVGISCVQKRGSVQKARREAWAKVDWTKPTQQVADEMQVTLEAAQWQKRKWKKNLHRKKSNANGNIVATKLSHSVGTRKERNGKQMNGKTK